MSACTVTTEHIDALLTAGLAFCTVTDPLRWYYPPPTTAEPDTTSRDRTLTSATAGRVGAMLLAENSRSVNHYYDEADWEPVYLFHPLPGTPDPLVVLKAIACLEYQSCEHPGWLDSEARVFCQALRRVAIAALPGYSAAQGWLIETRAIFQHSHPRGTPRWGQR